MKDRGYFSRTYSAQSHYGVAQDRKKDSFNLQLSISLEPRHTERSRYGLISTQVEVTTKFAFFMHKVLSDFVLLEYLV